MTYMELLIAVLLVTILGLLATVAGFDSRDFDPRVQPITWSTRSGTRPRRGRPGASSRPPREVAIADPDGACCGDRAAAGAADGRPHIRIRDGAPGAGGRAGP